MSTKYIIRSRASGGFFTPGGRWSDEYPDAQLYTAKKRAIADTAKAACSTQSGVEVIADYGTDSERIVFEVRQ